MSLDVSLIVNDDSKVEGSGIFICVDGHQLEVSRDQWDALYPGAEPPATDVDRGEEFDITVFTNNITHNLAKMAGEAGLHKPMWRPEEIGISKARQLIEPLQKGLDKLRSFPEHYRQFNPSNGWGNYEDLVLFAQEYLDACRKFPGARIFTCK